MKLNVSKRTLIIATLFGCILFAALVLLLLPKHAVQHSPASPAENIATPSNQEQEQAKQASATQEGTSIGMPARLKIPSIDVDAEIISVGLTSDGAMDVPKGPDEVAWFNRGARPGEKGTAVVTGHYGWKNNTPAVFDHLHTLEAGDKIVAEDENGKTTTFVVRETRIYDKDAIVPEVFDSSDGEGHLNLITCIGVWNWEEDTFSERLVIFTDKE